MISLGDAGIPADYHVGFECKLKAMPLICLFQSAHPHQKQRFLAKSAQP